LKEIEPGQGLRNEQRIIQEFYDLYSVMEMIHMEGVIERPPWGAVNAMLQGKRAKVEKFLLYSQKCGTLLATPETGVKGE
jgi:hypothetical protein